MKKSLTLLSIDSSDDNSYLSFYSSAETILKQYNKKTGKKKSNKKHFVIREIFERQKLQDKSISKAIRVPQDRKASRSCLPIKIDKVCKIKKKAEGKSKEKPNQRSLKKRKFSSPRLFIKKKKFKKKQAPEAISESDPEMVTDDKEIEKWLKSVKTPVIYEPVTPQLLVDALQYPLLLKDGASIDVIIRRLRTLKKTLHPDVKSLKEEVKKKLNCATKLGIVKEKSGLYWTADICKPRKLSPRKINAFWHLYSKKWMVRNCAKTRKSTAKYLPVPHKF